jgi:ankyrin repeat protein
MKSFLAIIAVSLYIGSATAQVNPQGKPITSLPILIAQPSNLSQVLRSAQDSDFDNVMKLVRSGMDPSPQDDLGNNALMLIIEAGHPEIAVSFINELKASVKLTDRSEAWKEIPLDWAYAVDRKNRTLMAADSQGRTPLMIAAAYGHTEVVRLLVSEDVPLDTQNHDGLTALMIAGQSGHPDIVDILTKNPR